ncbi:hypothetical protein BDU57DRAFT_121823 [Ampelomyces quisqualis]|uniref:Uncharacterized protein n=1 Tax=Ampelomyces quisqualis TaxID=50730 RepID=A0A6A5QVD3_AMPQU|nr:hypothetical protein BDU57DRAFT_121823 [Ampelomyces quisqualis]
MCQCHERFQASYAPNLSISSIHAPSHEKRPNERNPETQKPPAENAKPRRTRPVIQPVMPPCSTNAAEFEARSSTYSACPKQIFTEPAPAHSASIQKDVFGSDACGLHSLLESPAHSAKRFAARGTSLSGI